MSTLNLAKKISKKFSILTIALGFFASAAQAVEAYKCWCRYTETETNKSIISGGENGVDPNNIEIGRIFAQYVPKKDAKKICQSRCESFLTGAPIASEFLKESFDNLRFKIQETLDKQLTVLTYHKLSIGNTQASLRSHLCGMKTNIFTEGLVYEINGGYYASSASVAGHEYLCQKLDIK